MKRSGLESVLYADGRQIVSSMMVRRCSFMNFSAKVFRGRMLAFPAVSVDPVIVISRSGQSYLLERQGQRKFRQWPTFEMLSSFLHRRGQLLRLTVSASSVRFITLVGLERFLP